MFDSQRTYRRRARLVTSQPDMNNGINTSQGKADLQDPLLTIIIPTFNRPDMALSAVESALAQTIDEIEVLVVDDGSTNPPRLPDHPRLRLITLPKNHGGAYARNVAAEEARGRWISILDDDDRLFPNMAEDSLNALTGKCSLPEPVAVVSGVQVVNEAGEILQTNLPPTLPRGSHFSLENIERGKSIFCKNSLVIERELFLSIGGFDPDFRSRIHTEFFFRLNQECSLLGISAITYRQLVHFRDRITKDGNLRQQGFHKLLAKHRALFEAHPRRFAWYYHEHALHSFFAGQYRPALTAIFHALRLDPIRELSRGIKLFGYYARKSGRRLMKRFRVLQYDK